MRASHHSILIDAAPSAIRRAILDEAHIRKWWTRAAFRNSSGPKPTIVLRFQADRIEVSFEIAEPKENLIVWTCVAERNNPDWRGTTLRFQLAPENGRTRLVLTHEGWRDDAPSFAICDRGWPHFLDNIRRLVETGEDNALRNDEFDGKLAC